MLQKLTPDRYQIVVLADGQIRDLAGNDLETAATQEFFVVPMTTLHDNDRYTFYTHDGDSITVALSGPGQVTILEGSAVGSGNAIEQISISDTTFASSLRIYGSCEVSVGQILAESPLRFLNAPQVRLTSRLTTQQSFERVTLGDIADDSQITLIAPDGDPSNTATSGLRFTCSTLGDNVDVVVTGSIDQMTLSDWAGGTLQADDIDKLRVNTGDFNADIHVNLGNLSQCYLKKGNFNGNLDIAQSLGKLRAAKGDISGQITAQSVTELRGVNLSNLTVRAGEAINSLRANNGVNLTISAGTDIDRVMFKADLTDSDIAAGRDISSLRISGDALDNLFLAGVDLGSDAQLDRTTDVFGDGAIGQLFVRGVYTSTTAAAVDPGADMKYFTDDDTTLFSGTIGKVKFGAESLSATVASHAFGLLAAGTISPFKISGEIFGSPTQLDDFHIAQLA